jgi:3',5'-cyclic AMP phosphodiesterase CpdA
MELTKKQVRFLHISDSHFAKSGSPLGDQDFKNPLHSTSPRTREGSFERTISELSRSEGQQNIAAILLTGDYDYRGPSGGMVVLRDMLARHFSGAERPPIVAIPGNHDVSRGSDPGSPERYKTFVESWRSSDLTVITPFLDGIDDIGDIASSWERHCLISQAQDKKYIIVPINSCNWSQSKLKPRDASSSDFWAKTKVAVSASDATLGAALDDELLKFSSVDAALISDNQFSALKEIIANAEQKVGGHAIKIALIHHHLLPVNSREEHKIYGDIINLGKLRQFLRQHGFHVLLHGHKHSNAVYVDHIYEENSTSLEAHELLVVSGGTIDSSGAAACRLVDLEGLPHAPRCKISTVELIPAGGKLTTATIREFATRNLWRTTAVKPPYLISGTGIDQVYERACQVFEDCKTLNRPLICHIEFDPDEALDTPVPPPERYPVQGNTDGGNDDLVEWFKETVKWWQLPISKIEARIPYIHGTRLFRFGGAIDQVERIAKLLHKSRATSKAIAVLLDPIRDFKDDPSKDPERFASFCLVQFKVHNDVLECIAYYRAQEFRKWWPINVAELRKLQIEIGLKLQPNIRIGGITTIAGDARIEDNVSPTQVAVPIIDQWLDSYPQKIAAMAHAVLWPKHAGPSKPNYQEDWKKCFDDILIPTNSFTSEGIPVAVEGLDHLRMFLVEFADSSNHLHEELIAQVADLLKANEVFCNGKKDLHSFDNWSQQVKRHVAAITRHSKAINANPGTGE